MAGYGELEEAIRLCVASCKDDEVDALLKTILEAPTTEEQRDLARSSRRFASPTSLTSANRWRSIFCKGDLRDTFAKEMEWDMCGLA